MKTFTNCFDSLSESNVSPWVNVIAANAQSIYQLFPHLTWNIMCQMCGITYPFNVDILFKYPLNKNS